MLEALGANATRLQELTTEAERFRAPMEESAGAAGEMDATLQGISFTPAVDGARSLADELARGASAMSALQGGSGAINMPTAQPQVIDASYSPSPAGPPSSTAAQDDIMAALKTYGVPTVSGLDTSQGMMGFLSSAPEERNEASKDLVKAYDRTGQSKEYLSVLTSINEELNAEFQQLTLNNEARKIEKIIVDATTRARQEGVILSQQDIELIRLRAEALGNMGRELEFVDAMADSVFSNIGTALDQFVETGKLSFKDLAASIIADLARIANQAFILEPLRVLFGSMLGNFLGVGAQAAQVALPGYNNGADFMVGGAGGIDQNVVAFKATKGERVQVTPAGQTASQNNAGSTSVYVNVNIDSAVGDENLQKMVVKAVSTGLSQADKQLPDRITEISARNGRWRR